MDDVLALCADLPRRTLHAGEHLLNEGARGTEMFVLVSGAVEVRRGGVTLTHVTDPGAFLGEMSALLGTAYSADVVAAEPTTVVVIDQAAEAIAANPELVVEIARLLARRLHAVTSYLADLKRQYAATGGHLSMMDEVLSELMSMRPTSIEPGSERSDVPDY
jgi:CRP/FNR family transcriptional regulator, cyclic AMP receptor protein